MSKIKPQDHPDYVGGWVWTKLELDWINERIGTLEAALFQAQEAAKDLETRLTKTEGWLNEAMWNYGELKREQLANSEETSSSPVEDWEAIAADQALTIALLKSETAAQPAPVQSCYCPNCEALSKELAGLKAQPAPVQEPVAWVEKNGDLVWQNYEAAIGRNLYTTPPAQEFVCSTGLCHYKAKSDERLMETPKQPPAGTLNIWFYKGHGNYDFEYWGSLGEGTYTVYATKSEAPSHNSTCNETLSAQGKPYPRTCKKCGFGPCIGKPKSDIIPPAAQRQWVGLTDEEIENAFQETYIMGDSDLKDFAKVIEAKLKEKNT